jgi:hypothetical protein
VAEERNERDRNREEEQAIWEQLVASFDEEAEDDGSWPAAERLDGGAPAPDGGARAAEPLDEDAEDDEDDEEEEDGDEEGGDEGDGPRPGVNTTRTVVFSSGPFAAPTPGPRDWDDPEDDDEGHFVPPPPPPLPRLDVTARFAWIAVLGGPLLLLLLVLFQQDITWWTALLGIGGFLGGFGTLVARMKDRDENDDDPMGGAVV